MKVRGKRFHAEDLPLVTHGKGDAMDKIVYAQIRNEMTAIFTSFRQLEMGQYVVVAALVTTILSFSRTQLWVSLGAGIALAGLVLGVAWLGAEWFSAATRQSAYLLVAYEIPDLENHAGDREIDRKHLWILANRAESLKTLQEKYPGKHSFGTGLRTFYWHQAFLAAFSFIVIAIAFYPIWREADFPKFISAFIAALLLFDIGLCVFKGLQSESGDLGKSQLKKWYEYVKDRPEYDQKLLEFMDLKRHNKPMQPTR